MDMYFESLVKNCVKSFFFSWNSIYFPYLKTHLISPVGKKLVDLYLLNVSRLKEAALSLYLQKIINIYAFRFSGPKGRSDFDFELCAFCELLNSIMEVDNKLVTYYCKMDITCQFSTIHRDLFLESPRLDKFSNRQV